jgi:hypothetical protein
MHNAVQRSRKHLFYRRHFLLLTVFGICVITASLAHATLDLLLSFAVYGALHAAALVLALRVAEPFWRKCVFVAVAAVLCVLTVRIGVYAGRWLAISTAGAGLYLLFGLTSVIGAAAYGILVAAFGFAQLTARSLAAIAAGCLFATTIAVFSLLRAHFLGPWWLAVLWWYAFSAGLCCFDGSAQRPIPTPAPV